MIQGSSHARTARSATGHERCGRVGCMVAIFSPTPVLRGSRICLCWLVSLRPGLALVVPAEGEGAADQGPVPPDGSIGAHLVVAPAQCPLCLLVALLHPVPQAVQADDLGHVSRRQCT